MAVIDTHAHWYAKPFVDLLEAEMSAGCEFHGAYLDGGGYFVAVSPPS